MWHFDIHHDIYSNDMGRRIFIVTHEEFIRLGRREQLSKVYMLAETWCTPNSKGKTGVIEEYTFFTYQDAAMFIAEIVIKLNSLAQRCLMRAAEVFATRITNDYKETRKQMEVTEKKRGT